MTTEKNIFDKIDKEEGRKVGSTHHNLKKEYKKQGYSAKQKALINKKK